MEAFVADDLEPVDDGFDGGEGVEVGVGCDFLGESDVFGAPVEEETHGGVDDAHKDGGVEDGLPECGGAEDGFAAEEEVKDVGRGADEGVDYGLVEAWGGGGSVFSRRRW